MFVRSFRSRPFLITLVLQAVGGYRPFLLHRFFSPFGTLAYGTFRPGVSRKPRGCTNKILPAAVPPLRLSRRLRRRLNGY